MGKGQEKYLKHELVHNAQLQAGMVTSSIQCKGYKINQMDNLERMAEREDFSFIRNRNSPMKNLNSDIMQMASSITYNDPETETITYVITKGKDEILEIHSDFVGVRVCRIKSF